MSYTSVCIHVHNTNHTGMKPANHTYHVIHYTCSYLGYTGGLIRLSHVFWLLACFGNNDFILLHSNYEHERERAHKPTRQINTMTSIT